MKNRVEFKLWHELYGEINEINIYMYLLFAVAVYFSFFIFSKIGEKYKPKKNIDNSTFHFSKKKLWPLIGLIILIIVYYLVIFSDSFFKGYNSQISNVAQKGPLISALQVLLAISLIITSITTSKNSEFKSYKIINVSFIIYLVGSLLVLSLGGRLYFISGLFAIIVYISNREKSFNIWIASSLFIFTIILMGLIGVWRASSINIDSSNVLYNLFQEPIYTSYSLVDFLRTEQHKLIEVPRLLASEFLNLVPTILAPEKLEYISKPIDFGYHIYNPSGALHAYVSFAINFGLLGSIPIFGILGLGLGILKGKTNAFSQTMYSLVSSHLVFTFFRDGFVTSIIKNLFQYSILVPILIGLYLIIINKIKCRVESIK
ncbi:hypothetical protein J3A84_02925 [Proteiniclasticum sp. SCR006]|uniref:Oligosaccharide repeat unit polymerase n=1 Tax=Proteiniclasticum aestuarii TaxID=2817862 RepID=A0A939H974_9CLOT|nr:hypothetical protein [Proteiniclasticum aestuarii]MBO1263995.1 hypothetical protein [Proteiniclasticum aestuarii]